MQAFLFSAISDLLILLESDLLNRRMPDFGSFVIVCAVHAMASSVWCLNGCVLWYSLLNSGEN